MATRLEELAESGEIFISGTVYDHIKKKLAFSYDYLGEKTLNKNNDPVRVYRLKLDAAEPENEIKNEVELTIPDKPSIAVLPFDNFITRIYTHGFFYDLKCFLALACR